MTYSLTCGIQSERPRYKRDTGSSPFFLSSSFSCLFVVYAYWSRFILLFQVRYLSYWPHFTFLVSSQVVVSCSPLARLPVPSSRSRVSEFVIVKTYPPKYLSLQRLIVILTPFCTILNSIHTDLFCCVSQRKGCPFSNWLPYSKKKINKFQKGKEGEEDILCILSFSANSVLLLQPSLVLHTSQHGQVTMPFSVKLDSMHLSNLTWRISS